MACEVALAGALRGAGDTRYPMITTMYGLIIARLIPAWIFTNLGLSVYWILIVMLTDHMLKAAMVVYRFRSLVWIEKKINHAHESSYSSNQGLKTENADST